MRTSSTTSTSSTFSFRSSSWFHKFVLVLWCCVSIASVNGQDNYGGGGGSDPYYDQEYEQDNLYYDYAARQQGKAGDAGLAPAAGGGGGSPLLMAGGGGLLGWWIGSAFHCSRQKKKLSAKFKADQKALYQQYYEDVYALQIQNAELIQALEQLGVKIQKQ
ncbi:hypothetical protein ACA910_004462 [Epithemia clementina (nom. ined.)]